MSRTSLGRRGSVLLHVLMTGALVAVISATILRLAMLRYSVTARTQQVNQERRYNETALNLLITSWNSANKYCANVAGYYTCSGGAGFSPPLISCTCTCTPNGAVSGTFPTISNTNASPPCALSIVSNSSISN